MQTLLRILEPVITLIRLLCMIGYSKSISALHGLKDGEGASVVDLCFQKKLISQHASRHAGSDVCSNIFDHTKSPLKFPAWGKLRRMVWRI